MFVSIADVREISIARVLITALKAHGFHPLDNELGLPGMPGITGVRGTIDIQVPMEEQADAAILVEALLADMREEK